MRVKARRRRSEDTNPVGERQNQPFQVSFNSSLEIDFQGSRITSDAGLLVVLELDWVEPAYGTGAEKGDSGEDRSGCGTSRLDFP
jgi:hypothetical protein